MTAIVQDEYGEAEDVLRVEEIDRPQIGDDEVLLRVHAAGVDRGVWHLMTGLPYAIRLAGYGVRRSRTRVRGREVAGRVEAVGARVSTLKAGDEVFGVGEGCFAQYARARADRLAPAPGTLSAAQAAAVPLSALTALQAVRDHARVQPGQRVLVIGASGGVGTFAVQLATVFGGQVSAVCSTAKMDLVRSLGAEHVIDYTRADITDGHPGYDVILDLAGNRSLAHLRRVLSPRGTLVIVGGEGKGRWLGGTDRQIRALALSPFVRHTLKTFVTSENGQDLAILTGLIDSGQITPVLDRTYPLAQTAAAISYVAEGRARGKVVITV
ncbi:MAG: hypothetical protein QOH17_4495 [Pseudonocardiales bacterium]|jgi:NADPH:quinone reductase-like Zn-dependent oxidoreductase|nr:hypothetical protein [Pseudonocardiales bacterium]